MAFEGTVGRVERIGRERLIPARLSEKAPVRHLDPVLVTLALLLSGFGSVMVYSATFARLKAESLPPRYYLDRQAIFAVVGIVAMTVLALFSYRRLKAWAWLAYGVAVMLLIAVLTPLGTTVAGAQRWISIGIFQIQPSELTKLAVIIALAAVLAERRGDSTLIDVIRCVVLVGVPALLIYLQPDLGTLLVLLAILGAMLLVGGTRLRLLLVMVMLGAVAFWGILHVGLLKDYQINRLTSFMDPTKDLARTGYNLEQSLTAIGSGQLTGTGLFNGTQTNLKFVPEQHTDFIFTVIGEELGFAGAALFLFVFAMFISRGVRIAMMSKDHFGTLLAAGIVSMFAFQGFVNIGMTMGISPITGIPLPFVSYGGSSLIASFLATGILLNIHMRRL
jgi:rod shape determining protein RodA